MAKKKKTNKTNYLHKLFLNASRIIVYPSYYLYTGMVAVATSIKKIFVRTDDDDFSFDMDTSMDSNLSSLKEDYSSLEEMIENNNQFADDLYGENTSGDSSYISSDSEYNEFNFLGDNPANFSSEAVYNLYKSMQRFAKKYYNKKKVRSKLKLAKQLIIELNSSVDNPDVQAKKKSWRYEAINKKGRYVRGYCQASTKMDVINILNDSEMFVYRISLEKLSLNFGVGSVKIKTKDLIFMITQLSTYLKSGIALSDAIGILIRQTKNKKYQKVLYDVKYELLLGESLSNAMLHQKKAFPMILVNMVRSSELTGELPEVLDDMAEYFTEIEETRKQMISALTYPTLVLVFTIGVIIFVLLYVVPKFVDIYDSMEGTEIPAFTQAIINISGFIEKNVIYILLIVIIILVIILYLYKYVKVCRKLMQYVAMKLPVIGNIIIYNEVAVFSKTFSSLLKHNVFITESMEVLNMITNNEIFHDMILATITNLMKGDKLSSAFQDQWAFPIPAYEMIVTGEQTGQLAEMMDKVSVYYQGLHRNMVSRVKSLIEPIIIVLLTFGVGAILLAVVVPMFNMYQTVQNMEA